MNFFILTNNPTEPGLVKLTEEILANGHKIVDNVSEANRIILDTDNLKPISAINELYDDAAISFYSSYENFSYREFFC